MTTRTLSEAQSMAALAPLGVRFPRHCLVGSGDDADRSARVIGEDLGFPLVAKLCGESIAHKSDRGLVRLRLGDERQLASAIEELRSEAVPDDGDTAVLVAEMVSGLRELIVGISTDVNFGPLIMLGFGGVLAEAVGLVAVRLIPLTRVDALDMLDELAATGLLDGLRGDAPVDRRALVDVLLALSGAAAFIPNVESIDLNPLVVVNGQPIAVDALVAIGEGVSRDVES